MRWRCARTPIEAAGPNRYNPAMPQTAPDWTPFDQTLVINALGELRNPNLETQPDPAAAYASVAAAADERALRDARAAGLSGVNVTLGHVAGAADPFEATLHDITAWDACVRAHPHSLRKVLSTADLLAAQASGQVGMVYGFQNTEMLGSDPARVHQFSKLGVRVIQLTYNGRNLVGDGATVPDDRGLTPFGREVVQALEAEALLVDLSHSSRQTCLDALATATRPLAITHTGCRALCDHPRNKADDELRLLAERGGVVGIYAMPYLRPQGQPMAADWIAHIEHAIQVCGEDHVGLGTDGGTTLHDDPEALRRAHAAELATRRALGIAAPGEVEDVMLGLPDMQGVPMFRRLAAQLSARGHSDARIAKLLGGNFLRLFGEVWA
jgi:membrane dipeptidase